MAQLKPCPFDETKRVHGAGESVEFAHCFRNNSRFPEGMTERKATTSGAAAMVVVSALRG